MLYLKIFISKKTNKKVMALCYNDVFLTFTTETILKVVPYSYKDLIALNCGDYPIE